MKKIVLLPLDERPCNTDFPYKLFNSNEINIIRPEKLGYKKHPANFNGIKSFLTDSCKEAWGLVLSIDTLLYGGLIPSRLHLLSEEEIKSRLELIKELKKENRDLKIYASQCIMRCPTYSSSDEEPDYYEQYGKEIHKIGALEHRRRLGFSDDELEDLYEFVPIKYLNDYRNRREENLFLNMKTLDYVNEGLIDFLIIPQDDSAKYGFTAMDQEVVRKKIKENTLQKKVLMYPGADEVAMTLLSRAVNNIHNSTPKIFIKYASIHAPFIIPAYEDRALGETCKYQILAAGGIGCSSVMEADLVLGVTAPGGEMLGSYAQPAMNQAYDVERNLTEFIYFIEDQIRGGKPVTIGDNAYANGSDLELIDILDKNNLLMDLAGYAGWNTSSNTLGTAISQGILFLYRDNSVEHKDFLVERYIEDAGYCAHVRSYVINNILQDLDMNYFDIKEQKGVVSNIVHELLNDFKNKNLTSIAKNISIECVYMPWKRMFEVGLGAKYKDIIK